MKFKNILPLALAFIFSTGTYGQIEITEYSASNLESYLDAFQKTEDWIEIHNSGSQAVDITGWGISDKIDKPLKWRFPSGTTLNPDEYLHVWCSGRDLFDGAVHHTNFKLSQTKDNEYVVLSDPDGNIIESTEYELTLTEHSRVKINGEWLVSTSPSLASGGSGGIYDGYANTPTISLKAGYYQGSQTVQVNSNDTDVVTRYSLDGNEPTSSSPEIVNGQSITISETVVFKAKNFPNSSSILPSKIDFATYFIDENFTLPVFSIGADQVQDLAAGQGEIIPIGTIEYFDAADTLAARAYGSLNRHGQDSWVLPHRSLDWVTRDEMGYTRTVDAKLFNYSDRTDYQRFMMRASGDDNYPAIDDNAHQGSCHIRDEYVHELAQIGKMKVDLRAVERVIVYLNGDYWGVYGLRERPVDHDYTAEYYDQDKYNLQYLLTWGNTWAEYGGDDAFDDWEEIRDFALTEDMSIPENYQVLKDNIQLLGLIDYMITNLNVVSQDWLNYNTGWWRGLDPDGDHKKWGYMLWDNDATFDYYINYTGVPNTDPDATPCDIDVIADSMDSFFGGGFGGGGNDGNDHGGEIIPEPGDCETIMNGSSPYNSSDSIFIQVINNDNYCCCVEWTNACQNKYNEIESTGTMLPLDYNNCGSIINGTSPYTAFDENFQITINQFPGCCDEWSPLCESIYGLADNGFFDGTCEADPGGGGVTDNNDVGKHEKIFLKLQDESEEFRQLYYSRQADMMNTAFSCETMLSTLDSMLNTIRPEMPRHIDRWGGTLQEWEANVDRLISFVEQRCELLDVGMTECFDVTGPYDLTVDIRPIGVGEVKLNTLDLTSFPFTGAYFGNMDNLLEAKPLDSDEWAFSHWELEGGSQLSPTLTDDEISIILTSTERITAVFTDDISATDDQLDISKLILYPTPVSEVLTVEYELAEDLNFKIEIYSALGQKVKDFPFEKHRAGQTYIKTIDVKSNNLAPGVYNLSLTTGQKVTTKKFTVIR